MEKKRKILIVMLVIAAATSALGYSQYAAAKGLNVSIKDSKLLEKSEEGNFYKLMLEFDNPSYMALNVGSTDFSISVNEEDLGSGNLEASIIPPNGKVITETTFLADQKVLEKYRNENGQVSSNPDVKLSGKTKYDVFITTLEMPFTYFPSEGEVREFIEG